MPGPRRIKPRDILPSAVKNRGLGNVINLFDTQEATTTLNNGDDAVLSLTIVNQRDAAMIAEPEFSLWEGSISSANLLPGGSNIDESQWQIIGPWNEWTEGAVIGLSGAFDVAIPEDTVVSKIYIRNISAGASTDAIARVRVRYLTNADDVS